MGKFMLFHQINKERVCPACRSTDVYRVKRVGLTVKAMCRILDLRPHWCANCDNFFLAPRESAARHCPAKGCSAVGGDDSAKQSHAGGISH